MRLWGWDFNLRKIFLWVFVVALPTAVWLILENRYNLGALCFFVAGYAKAKATYWKLMEQNLRLLVGESPYDVPARDRVVWFIRTQPKAFAAQDRYAPRPHRPLELLSYNFVLYVLKSFGLQWKNTAWKMDPAKPRLEVISRNKKA